MKAAIFGGTFNPVHIGHLFIADEVLKTLAYDTVFFVPANIPAHKAMTGGIGTADRLRMLEAAVEPYSEFKVETCEIDRGGVSFSIDTVRHMIGAHGLSAKPGFILGDDLIEGFPKWKNADRLADESNLIVARRGSEAHRPFPYPHLYIRNPLLTISSSMVRERIRKGIAYRFLVPHSVWIYIESKGLYCDD